MWWFEAEVKAAYLLSYGDWDTEGFNGLQWILFTIFTLMIPLVFLNLLIAIISDTFDRVFTNKTISDYKEKASLILEMEEILICRKRS